MTKTPRPGLVRILHYILELPLLAAFGMTVKTTFQFLFPASDANSRH